MEKIVIEVEKYFADKVNPIKITKEFSLNPQKCDIDIGLGYEIYITKREFDNINIIVKNEVLGVGQKINLKSGDSKFFIEEFSNLTLQCTIRYGE